jgi:Protein of unknown function (DUF664)
MDDPRIDPPLEAGEQATLTAFLDYNRETLALKCDGLTDDQLRERAVPPSSLSLLGIVRHMAEVDWEGAFRDVATGDAGEAFSTWRAECDHARALVASDPTLETRGFRGGEWFSLRCVLNHMIEEYARHNGHADLLRERLDGVTGE